MNANPYALAFDHREGSKNAMNGTMGRFDVGDIARKFCHSIDANEEG